MAIFCKIFKKKKLEISKIPEISGNLKKSSKTRNSEKSRFREAFLKVFIVIKWSILLRHLEELDEIFHMQQ